MILFLLASNIRAENTISYPDRLLSICTTSINVSREGEQWPELSVDCSTLEHISDAYYKDKSYVYFWALSNFYFDLGVVLLTDADPSTFVILDKPYSRDKNHVYYYDRQIKNADVDSFTVINKKYSKDKNHLYFRADISKEAAPIE